MNEQWLDTYTSKEFKLLSFLNGKQIVTVDGERIPLSQKDIAKEFGNSIATINTLMSSLRKTGCIKKHKQKSGYLITERGRYVINHFNKISKYCGGRDNG